VTERTTARHRADQAALTPLSDLGTTISSAMIGPATAGRTGLVLAASSGLVAAMGLPSSAALTAGHGGQPQTGAVPQLQTVAASTLGSAPITAPRDATVSFEHPAFRAVPSGTHSTTPATATRDVSRISRSLARSAYQAQLKASAGTGRHAVKATVRTAARKPQAQTSQGAASFGSARGASVIAVATRYLGVPYLYGGASPRGFDCSGFSMYVYGLLGISLPRTAQQQYNTTTRIARSQAMPGDLVFFFTGGYVTHMGIYLGNNMMIAAPHTGSVVREQPIYSANVAFGRV
jgi:peptidoglycan DL-endopeptidase CwlO